MRRRRTRRRRARAPAGARGRAPRCGRRCSGRRRGRGVMKRYETRCSACSSTRRFRIAACTDTSSADVGSSQTTSFGSPANARAIATRCLRPPESCTGFCVSVRSVTRTRAARSCRRRLGSAPPRPGELLHRAEQDPTHRVTAVERRVRVLEHDLERSQIVPRALLVDRREDSRRRGRPRRTSAGTIPSSVRASVVLPLPDSPTSPSVSPGQIAALTPMSACTSCPR